MILDDNNKNDYDIYDDCENLKFIWGIKSYDDLCSCDCNLYTMNDFDIIYNKETQKYFMGVETVYQFREKDGEKIYIKNLLDKFTEWMIKSGYNISKKLNIYEVFTAGYNINTEFDNLEDLYATFKFCVDAFIGG